jgi:hypothetical protein
MQHILVTALAALLPVVALSAQTVTVALFPTQDNTLYQDATGQLSNGAGQFLFAGKTSSGNIRRALLAFDPTTAIPARSRIVAVQLTLGVTQTSATAPTAASLHRVTAAWGESTSLAPGSEGNGGPAAPQDATWLHSFFPGTPWTTPGGDFAATASSQADLPLLGPVTFPSSDQLAADVQDWLDGRPNHGWLLKTDEVQNQSARKFASRQNTAQAALLPTLSVTYLPPGNIASFGTGCSTSGNQSFQQLLQGPTVQGGAATLTTQSGVPFGLFVTLLSYDLRTIPAEPEAGCFWFLRDFQHPNLGIRVQDANGNLSENFPIPVDPVLAGIPIALQSILVDWAHPRQWAISNAHLLCIQ